MVCPAVLAILVVLPVDALSEGYESGSGPPGLELEINLPAYRLDVLSGGRRVARHTVCIGAVDHPTPIGDFQIDSLVWNPWWHPPPSPWAAGRVPMPPGPANPMGRAKLYFRDLYYLHGTADEASLGCAASHGCVRMSNTAVVELARRVHRYGVPGADPVEIDRLAAAPATATSRTVLLVRPVTLTVTYRVAEVRDDQLLVHADVYQRVGGAAGYQREILAALEAAGYAAPALDEVRVAALAARPPRVGEVSVALPVATLLAEPTPTP